MKYNVEDITKVLNNKSYSVFSNDKKQYNINLVGIRSNDNVSNKFNDLLYVFYKYNGNWIIREYNVTTDPGLAYRIKPINQLGTAILMPGQYKGLWQIGKHQNKYKALVQKSPCTVIRDNNKDSILDYNIPPFVTTRTIKSKDGTTIRHYLDGNGKVVFLTETGMFGINCHKSGNGKTVDVNLYSAGCIVFSDNGAFEDSFLPICDAAAKLFGNSFTFTLITDNDFI